jgi:hypothetical protein
VPAILTALRTERKEQNPQKFKIFPRNSLRSKNFSFLQGKRIMDQIHKKGEKLELRLWLLLLIFPRPWLLLRIVNLVVLLLDRVASSFALCVLLAVTAVLGRRGRGCL